jgi:hypothetical protein
MRTTLSRQAVTFHEPKDLRVSVHALHWSVLAEDSNDPHRAISQRHATNATPHPVERCNASHLDAVVPLQVPTDPVGPLTSARTRAAKSSFGSSTPTRTDARAPRWLSTVLVTKSLPGGAPCSP